MGKEQERKISRYRVHPEDRVLVEIWIDNTNDDLRILRSGCIFTQGTAPCSGNPLNPCHSQYKFCNNSSKSLCTDETGMLKYQHGEEEFKKRYKREWAYFSRETWAIRSYIDSKSVVFDPMTNQRIFDIHRKQQLTLRCLLKSWSLGKYDDELAIRLITVPELSFSLIQEEQIKIIGEIDPNIIESFLNGYARKVERGIYEEQPEEIKDNENL